MVSYYDGHNNTSYFAALAVLLQYYLDSSVRSHDHVGSSTILHLSPPLFKKARSRFSRSWV